MINVNLDLDLQMRLREVARRQGKSPEDCAAEAIRTYVADHEEARRLAAPFGGDGAVRLPDDPVD